jgi:O-methyltransferase involved in polyketide biosynthesis
MSETKSLPLSGVKETMLITLYLRAMESHRPDALLHDEKAVALVERLPYDFERIQLLHLNEANKIVIILRSRQFDRIADDFLRRHPDAVVVHIGCGLDLRFERIDNGQVEWYDLDLPEVIELRREILGGKKERYHLLGCSVLEQTWIETVSAYQPRPFLFLAEGVFMYLHEAQVKSLVHMLRQQFSGAELVFDIYSPFHRIVSNLQTRHFGFGIQAHWGIWHGQELESWVSGIRLLDEWCYQDEPEPRVADLRWLRPVETLFRTLRIYHFRLGETAE